MEISRHYNATLSESSADRGDHRIHVLVNKEKEEQTDARTMLYRCLPMIIPHYITAQSSKS